jgi:hypothetical protein
MLTMMQGRGLKQTPSTAGSRKTLREDAAAASQLLLLLLKRDGGGCRVLLLLLLPLPAGGCGVVAVPVLPVPPAAVIFKSCSSFLRGPTMSSRSNLNCRSSRAASGQVDSCRWLSDTRGRNGARWHSAWGLKVM